MCPFPSVLTSCTTKYPLVCVRLSHCKVNALLLFMWNWWTHLRQIWLPPFACPPWTEFSFDKISHSHSCYLMNKSNHLQVLTSVCICVLLLLWFFLFFFFFFFCSYFTETWSLAVFHDRFTDFRDEVRELLITRPVSDMFWLNGTV